MAAYVVLISLFLLEVLGGNELSNASISRQRNKNLPAITEGELCTPGMSYKMDCNRCHCTETGKLVCSKMACVDWSNFIKNNNENKITMLRTRLKDAKPKGSGKLSNKKGKLSNPTGKSAGPTGKSMLPNLPKGKCVPGKYYKRGCRRCFCNELGKSLCSNNANGACELFDGFPIPVMVPTDVRPPFSQEELKKAPRLSGYSQKCMPGKTYKVYCNDCICTERNNLICTTYACLNFELTNSAEARDKSGKKCIGTKVTRDSCVECRCSNGKTACDSIKGCTAATKARLLKTANSIGITFKTRINQRNDHCVPGAIYTDNCNTCWCESGPSLSCTLKFCINYASAKFLNDQFQQLLEKKSLTTV